jgi:glucosyl-dolichyl phosphate glucuronosyltransferase
VAESFEKRKMPLKPLISVIICTYNRARLLEQCIQSLLQQQLDRALFEIIVVNNASTDETNEILDKFSHELFFRTVFEPVSGLSKARNTGWLEAKGEYIGYIDDDATADPQWLQSALWCFLNLMPRPDIVTGPIRLNSEVMLPEWIDTELKIPLGYLDWGKKCTRITYADKKIIGANCFFLKSTLKSLGGFNEELGRKKKLLLSGEEVQLQKEVEQLGGSVWYHPDVSIKHFVPRERTLRKWFYNRYYWGGVSDCIMSRIPSSSDTDHIKISVQEKGNKVPHSLQQRLEQVCRFLKNIFCSIGIFFKMNDVIRSRIYMSYVFGYLYCSLVRLWEK